jgi:folate-binding protein YgfZ
MRIRGDKAPELVTGLVTNDVLALQPGQGQYAAALTAKGKICADVRIFREEAGLLIDASPRAAPGWHEMVKKFINPRLAPYEDVTAQTVDIGIFGQTARALAAHVTTISAELLATLPPYGHLQFPINDEMGSIACIPDIDVEGFELFLPADTSEGVTKMLVAAGAVRGSQTLWDIARVEAGRPEWGIDMNDSTIPQEANLDEFDAISYTKGCYIGQETVARVHFRGHVNRMLRRVKFVCGAPPPSGAELVDEEGKVVGELRSVTISPRLGGVGIAMVRREFGNGTTLEARWQNGSCSVQLQANEKGATV